MAGSCKVVVASAVVAAEDFVEVVVYAVVEVVASDYNIDVVCSVE